MESMKVAVLDLYNNVPNEGMRCILQLIRNISAKEKVELTHTVFNVRGKNEVPGLEYDIYISSGGPGSPLPSDEPWEDQYFALIDRIFQHNRASSQKKYLFLICHSFQLVSRHLGIGTISKRKSTSFGIFPIHKTDEGQFDPLFQKLPDPFFAVDSRDYQLTEPNWQRISELDAKVLCLEKIRPHVDYERAIMAVRFTDEIFGTQFHPEADGEGMLRYFMKDEKKQQIVENHGEAKYNEMVASLMDPQKIVLTESVLIPDFLRQTI
ncbi:type 1 glutamine amidotransferase [Larkinella terrae]|uniref:GMP synthase n=1 Tax=Larkinella terrae TaxID=2025311 RepID=A0A7K0ELE5_9BACT|nr:GMP synthase [Larkinella terrae]MRS62604.1 GMP synthase [Larkinella terrae]